MSTATARRWTAGAVLRESRHRVDLVVWAMIAVTTVARAVVIVRSFYWQDDYIHLWKTWQYPATDMILQEWNGHREPLSFGVIWVLGRLWPQQWLPAAAVLILLAAALPSAFWLAVRRLAGPSPAAVIAAVGFCLWPGLLIPATWLSSGVETFAVVAILIALLLYARPSRWRIPTICALLVVGYGFNERALFMLPVLVTAGVLFGGDARGVRGLRAVLRRDRALWGWLLTLSVVLGVGARLLPRAPNGGRPAGAVETLQGLWYAGPAGVFRDTAGLNFLWPQERSTLPLATPLWMVAATAVVWAALIAVAVRVDRRQLLVAVVAVVGFLVVETALVALFRGGFIGPTVHQDARYYTLTGMILLLAVASFPSRPPQLADRVLLGVPAVVLIIGFALSLPAIARTTNGDSARAWLAAARAQFVGPQTPPMVSTPSPPYMLSDIFIGTDEQGFQFDLATTRTLLMVGPAQPTLMTSSLLPVGADLDGRLAPVRVDPVRSTTPLGFGAQCSVRLGGSWTRVGMSEAGLGNPLLAIDYLADRPGSVMVRAGDWEQGATLEAGLKTLWVTPTPGPFTGYEIRSLDANATICIGAARAGSPVAGPAAELP